MAGLLEQARAAGLGLAELLRGLAVRVGEQLTDLVAGRVEDLCALALALLPEPFDLTIALGELGLPVADFLFRARDLRGRGALRVALQGDWEVFNPR
jgi:hypothetical protein